MLSFSRWRPPRPSPPRSGRAQPCLGTELHPRRESAPVVLRPLHDDGTAGFVALDGGLGSTPYKDRQLFELYTYIDTG